MRDLTKIVGPSFWYQVQFSPDDGLKCKLMRGASWRGPAERLAA